MKYLKQITIILLVSLVGEILRMVLPFPIPASVYGLVLMLVLLMVKVIKLDDVKDTALFLIEIMPIMFIPAGVGLMTSWPSLQPIFASCILIIVLSTIIVLVVSGKVVDYMLKREDK